MAITKITGGGITADAIDGTKIADDAINSEHLVDGGIDNDHLANDAIAIAKIAATGTASSSTFLRGDNTWATAGSTSASDLTSGTLPIARIANDAIDSIHYAAASIDNEHLADDAVGVAELSATGTASATTFLRGDNTWGTPIDTIYTHPTTAGNKHIPTSGSSGQFLKYDSSGTAVWATPSYTTLSDSVTSTSTTVGASSAAAKSAYDNVPTHTHSYQAADADLLAIGGLTGTSGYLKKTAADTWTLDTSTFNNYSHPTNYDGDDFSIDTTALTGATVVSDIDINVTTDTSGHVTDANGSVSTRTLTLADLGYTGSATANNYSHPTHNGDDFSIDTGHLSGATVIDDIDINVTTDSLGHVTDANGTVATRNLTLADLGYTGSATANNYSLPSSVIHESELSSSTSSTSTTIAANLAGVKAAYDRSWPNTTYDSSDFLPAGGGTLSGGLTGTTANFSGNIDTRTVGLTTATNLLYFGIYNGNSAGTSNNIGTGITWKPNHSGYTKRSAGIMQIGEGNYFRSGLAFYTNGTSDATTDWSEKMRLDMNGNLGLGTNTPYDSNWGSVGANKEFAIDGTTGYAVLHLRGTGAGSTDTRFSQGVGDGQFYMAYDDVASTHRLTISSTGTAAFSGAVTWSGGGSANANTAYGWGNHASGGYAASSHTHTDITETQINNSYDLDSLSDGWYKWASNVPTNAPWSYAIMLQASDPNQKIQLAFGSSGSGKLAVRRADSGTFYDWANFWSEDNDGSGSGLDADKLDGVEGSGYATSSHTHSYLPLSGGAMTGNISFPAGQNIIRTTHSSGFLEGGYNNVGNNSAKSNPIYTIGSSYNPTDTAISNMYGIGYSHSNFWSTADGKPDGWGQYVASDGDVRIVLGAEANRGIWIASGGSYKVGTNTVWHVGNDGSGSGLDADTVDGIQAANFVRSDASDTMSGTLTLNGQMIGGLGAVTTGGTTDWNHATNARSGSGYTLLSSATNAPTSSTYFHPVSYEYSTKNGTGNMTQFAIPYNGVSMYHRYRYSGTWTAWNQEWNSSNDGSGSGLDADLLDGYNSAENGGSTIHRLASNGYSQLQNWTQVATSGLYSGTNGAHFYPNTLGSYGTWRINGARGGYSGIMMDTGGDVVTGMFDSSGNGGDYNSSSGWHYYYHRGNDCLGIGESTTSSSYGAYVTGALYATGNITAYSDRRIKENIVQIDGALEKVNKLTGVYYNNIDDETKNKEIGFIAQDVQEVVPELVTYAEDVDQYGVSYGNASALLVEAVKELTEQVNNLKQEIKEMKEKK